MSIGVPGAVISVGTSISPTTPAGSGPNNVPPIAAPKAGTGYFSTAVTKEAPVNVTHPDFGADNTGATDPTIAINNAVAFAATAAAQNKPSEVLFPGGIYRTTGRIQTNAVSGMKLFGEGIQSTIISQQTDNEPIIEMSGTGFTIDCEISDMQLFYQNQQAWSASSNAAAIRLLTTNINGFAFNTFKNVAMVKACFGIQWGPPSSAPTQAVSFWNNRIIQCRGFQISGALIQNSTGTSVGMPTNWVERLEHQGQAAGQGQSTACLNLAVGSWEFASLDLEDWTDRLIFTSGNATLSIRGMHVERHHAVTSNIKICEIDQTTFHLDRLDFSTHRDGTGPYFLFGFGGSSNNFARGYMGSLTTNTYTSGDLGSGTIYDMVIPANQSGDSGTQIVIGPRNTNDTVNTRIWSPTDTLTPTSVCAVNGLPPTQLSSVALPTASAAYRGQEVFLQGANGTTADQLVKCMQSATGTYSWKVIATG